MRRSGTLAIFTSAAELERAVHWALKQGIRDFEPITPYAVESISALAPPRWEKRFRPRNWLATFTLAAGLTGLFTGFGLPWLANSWAWPMNAGGRPYFSWPNFIPITFVLGILFAALTVFLGFILIAELPELNHPVFEAPSFRLDEERFYLYLPGKEASSLRELQVTLPATRLEEVSA